MTRFCAALSAVLVYLIPTSVFAQGSLTELRQDERVLDIYLGRRRHAEA